MQPPRDISLGRDAFARSRTELLEVAARNIAAEIACPPPFCGARWLLQRLIPLRPPHLRSRHPENRSNIGAIWLGRWQVTQLLNKIAATSLLNVGGAPVAVWAPATEAAAIAMAKTAALKINGADFMIGFFLHVVVSCSIGPMLMHVRPSDKEFFHSLGESARKNRPLTKY
jgi:hypothetical protein